MTNKNNRILREMLLQKSEEIKDSALVHRGMWKKLASAANQLEREAGCLGEKFPPGTFVVDSRTGKTGRIVAEGYLLKIDFCDDNGIRGVVDYEWIYFDALPDETQPDDRDYP